MLVYLDKRIRKAARKTKYDRVYFADILQENCVKPRNPEGIWLNSDPVSSREESRRVGWASLSGRSVALHVRSVLYLQRLIHFREIVTLRDYIPHSAQRQPRTKSLLTNSGLTSLSGDSQSNRDKNIWKWQIV